jgi:hypothetical protein
LPSSLTGHGSVRHGRPGRHDPHAATTGTDWPGHYPNVADTIRVLVEAGANVSARFTGPRTETPLHWAASSDDLDALDALLDDAAAFAQWHTARLVERCAREPASAANVNDAGDDPRTNNTEAA